MALTSRALQAGFRRRDHACIDGAMPAFHTALGGKRDRSLRPSFAPSTLKLVMNLHRIASRFTSWMWLAFAIICLIGVATIVGPLVLSQSSMPVVSNASGRSVPKGPLATTPRLTVWWDFPQHLAPKAENPDSNVQPADYVGPEACQQCHAKNFEAWSKHPHRWMNAIATDQTVLGDFSDSAGIDYRGGNATFRQDNGQYMMTLERGAVRRAYQVTQTIGSRFFQYYVGRQIEGPEPPEHDFYHKEHVLPFGYWLSEREWVPAVHIGPELPDESRPDPYQPPASGHYYAEYSASCNYCHSTFALGDMLARRPHQMGEHAPAKMHWSVHDYLSDARPDQLPAMSNLHSGGAQANPMARWDAEHYAVTFGITCEACHLGTRAHVESRGKILPQFFPVSASLATEGPPHDTGKTVANVNWACGRCHTGGRPSYAAGMSTWNSVEFADAARGSCYSEMRCIECHNPHQALGESWQRSADQDDAVCLKCHGQFKAQNARAAHTHHPAGSEGDRCLNCHMPRINEGLQDVVRTHTIFSPTQRDMIEKNQPNACNLCHVEQTIDWTLERLGRWYGRTYDATKLAKHYPHRAGPVAHGWLKSDQAAVRLVAADALSRSGDRSAALQVLDAMNDPFLVNRQFAARDFEKLTGVRPGESGYRFYQSRKERSHPLEQLRDKLMSNSTETPLSDGEEPSQKP